MSKFSPFKFLVDVAGYAIGSSMGTQLNPHSSTDFKHQLHPNFSSKRKTQQPSSFLSTDKRSYYEINNFDVTKTTNIASGIIPTGVGHQLWC
jgi:hypothetical protein